MEYKKVISRNYAQYENIIKKKSLERIGEKHITTQGYEVEVIEYYNTKNCTIKFNDERGTILKNIQYTHIKTGNVRNPYHPSVLGIGYIGEGIYNTSFKKVLKKEYNAWQNIINRCYNEELRRKFPTYKGVFLCEEWKCFQVFAEWFCLNYKEGWDLDKDIICKNCKVYSPETCAFVPHEINCLLVINHTHRGQLPIGVCKVKGDMYTAQLNRDGKDRYLGTFNTLEEAFQTYKAEKEKWIKEVADKWKPFIDPRVYEAMYNYQVEIND